VFAQKLAKRGDIQVVMPWGKDQQVLFRELKQTSCRWQAPAVFGMLGVFEIFLQMNEGAGSLDQSLEKIVVRRVRVQPKLLQNIVRFVIALFVPTPKERAIKWMIRDGNGAKIDIFSFQLADEPRNPLAFAHEGLNLTAAQMMGNPRGFIFPESSPEDFRGRSQE
jgi:hypothetical protein